MLEQLTSSPVIYYAEVERMEVLLPVIDHQAAPFAERPLIVKDPYDMHSKPMVALCAVVNFGTRLVAKLDLHGATFAFETKAHIGLYGAKATFDLHVGHSRGGLECMSNLLFHLAMYSPLTHWSLLSR